MEKKQLVQGEGLYERRLSTTVLERGVLIEMLAIPRDQTAGNIIDRVHGNAALSVFRTVRKTSGDLLRDEEWLLDEFRDLHMFDNQCIQICQLSD